MYCRKKNFNHSAIHFSIQNNPLILTAADIIKQLPFNQFSIYVHVGDLRNYIDQIHVRQAGLSG
jgi:hypothetical protein